MRNYTHRCMYTNVHYVHENNKLYNIQTVAKHTIQTHTITGSEAQRQETTAEDTGY